jgi:hypothetical protein
MGKKPELLKIEDKKCDLFISRECLEEHEGLSGSSVLRDWKEDEMKRFFIQEFIINPRYKIMLSNPLQRELIDLNSRKFGLGKRSAILDAHGKSVHKKWHYCDGRNSRAVQEWVDENDGRYACLLLSCCNPGRHKINSRRSAVIAAADTYAPLLQESGDANTELFIPEIGYVTDYVLEDEIRRMKKMLRGR